MNQHDKVRKHPFCPSCGEPKERDLLLCWGCHHDQKRKFDGDYGPRVKKLIAQMDARLNA